VERPIREQGLKARRKKSEVNTTDSRHSPPAAENLLNREFSAGGSEREAGARHSVSEDERRTVVCGGDTGCMGSQRDRMGVFGGRGSRSCMRCAYDGPHEPRAEERSALSFGPESTGLR
jgi:hypothetical protein